jgi:hypothetical protein
LPELNDTPLRFVMKVRLYCRSTTKDASVDPENLAIQLQRRRKLMSRKDAVLLASRVFALLLTVGTLVEVSYLPEFVQSFLRYSADGPALTPSMQHLRHYDLIRLAFLITRIVGYSFMARWIYKGGPEVEELFLPSASDEGTSQS